jgi:hypothetical protein
VPAHKPGYYRYEPFQPSNTVALKSGAHSERFWHPLATTIANDLLERHERLRNPLFREAVGAYSRTLAKIDLLEKYLAEVGLREDGDISNSAKFWAKLATLANNQAAQLGLTPLANARLGKDSASAQVDLATLAAKMAQTIDGEVDAEEAS